MFFRITSDASDSAQSLVPGWRLKLQGESPASGLDFIRYQWNADTEKASRELGREFRHTSRQALEDFAHGIEPGASSDLR